MSEEKVNKLALLLRLESRAPLDAFWENPCEETLRAIPRRAQTCDMAKSAIENDGMAIKSCAARFITPDLCKVAVRQNGMALRYVPKQLITGQLCRYAVQSNGLALQYVPQKFITEHLCECAIQSNALALQYIPKNIISRKLCESAIQNNGSAVLYTPKKWMTKKIAFQIVHANKDKGIYPISRVPKSLLSTELLRESLSCYPGSIQDIPAECLTEELCQLAAVDPLTIQWIPECFVTREMCLAYIEAAGENKRSFHIGWIPAKMRNDRVVLDALIQKLGVDYILEWNKNRLRLFGESRLSIQPLSADAVEYLQSIVSAKINEAFSQISLAKREIPCLDNERTQSVDTNCVCRYDLTTTENMPGRTVYYITDIHLELQLEDQLKETSVNLDSIRTLLDEKIAEMLPNDGNSEDYILIGGDTGSTKELVTLFYERLSNAWKGGIISVLGNHELWDDSTTLTPSRPLDEIYDDYRNRINPWGGFRNVLLQNEVYIIYKNNEQCIITEEQILTSTDDDLKEILSKSSFVLLGGTGFSGLDPYYNASLLLYLSAVPTLEEDKALSRRFELVYEKISRCASDRQVLVLTHTPVYDWTSTPYNPKWVYINGHTHRNNLIRRTDGTTVLSDNQIGNTPVRWKLNAFTLSGWYDPFADMADGVHEITPDEYLDFNRGRGIHVQGCNVQGKIYALKRNDYYLFLNKSFAGLNLLEGGQRKRLTYNNIIYYYDNMLRYIENVKKAILPYRNVLEAIANEVRYIGGQGYIHGCIVDIDFLNHIYLNPYDGKIVPYFAYSMGGREVYSDLQSLVVAKIPELSEKLLEAQKKNTIPLLSQYAVDNCEQSNALAIVPQVVVGTEMYAPSRIMRSVQYVIEGNVVRIWNEEILCADAGSDNFLLEESKGADTAGA